MVKQTWVSIAQDLGLKIGGMLELNWSSKLAVCLTLEQKSRAEPQQTQSILWEPHTFTLKAWVELEGRKPKDEKERRGQKQEDKRIV